MSLYLIPTPIGNLGDMTIRAIEILKLADLVLAEDTRISSHLLSHYDIDTPLKAYHMHNEHQTVNDIVRQLQSGKTIALISDAGTPGISDPGFSLVRACIEQHIHFECLPGATAFVPALMLSGLPPHQFSFWGFPPPKKGRKSFLENIIIQNETSIFYESPHKLVKTLEALNSMMAIDRIISASREISKKFEETIRGNASELLNHFQNKPPKGEFVICVEGLDFYQKRIKRKQQNEESYIDIY